MKELLSPTNNEGFLELEVPLFGSGVGLENVDGLTKTVFETTTNGIPLPLSPRWDCQNVIGYSGGT